MIDLRGKSMCTYSPGNCLGKEERLLSSVRKPSLTCKFQIMAIEQTRIMATEDSSKRELRKEKKQKHRYRDSERERGGGV